MMRKLALSFILAFVFLCIAAIFWYQEIQYLLPTPVPENYRVVLPREVIRYDSTLIPQRYSKPKLLHFFNPDCPCSRFNVKHFVALKRQYGQRVDFYVAVTGQEKVESAKRLIDTDIAIIVDTGEGLAKACGVYSTPQAALIQANNQLYFRGNYNRARYCTDPNTNFVQMAIDSLVSNKQPPLFNELATRSYGCSIGQQDDYIQLP
ncbi:MAG TPA: hypothetical protein VFU05_19775 [Cyclobacteriaceae bacterium]|nr:hypothetical protein [Cyclobacteriaceae bacterium]